MAKTAHPSDLSDKVMVRLPDGWRKRLKEIAEGNRRSVNAELLVHIEKLIQPSRVAS